MQEKFANYKILKTMPADGFYAEYCIGFNTDKEAEKIEELLDIKHYYYYTDYYNDRMFFFAEVVLFAVILTCVIYRGNDEIKIHDNFEYLSIKEIKKNENIDAFEETVGLVCSQEKGNVFPNIVLATDAFLQSFPAWNNCTLLRYTKNIERPKRIIQKDPMGKSNISYLPKSTGEFFEWN